MQNGKVGFITKRLPKIHPSFKKPYYRFISILFFGLTVASLSTSPLLARAIQPGETASLQQLQILSLKRELRVFKPDEKKPPHFSALKTHYTQNNFKAVVRTFEALSKKEKDSDLLLIYGNALFFLGRSEDAVAAYQRSFRQARSPDQQAAAMANFGLILSKQSRWKVAAQWLEQALEIDRDEDNWVAQGIGLSVLGNIYFQMGDSDKGAAAHIESLEIAEIIPVPWLEGRQSNFLANLYYLDGILHLAEDYFKKALKIHRRLADPLGEAAALTGLGFVRKDKHIFDKALEHQSDALAIYRRLEDSAKETKALLNLALIYRDKGDFKAALDFGSQAYAIQEKQGNVRGMAEIGGTIGTIYQKKGDLPEAIRQLEKSRRFFQEARASQQIHIVDLRIQALKDQLGP